MVNTNGIYVAFNNNVSAFRKVGDSSLALQSIKVIRFVAQGKGIIIPESLIRNELLDSARIRTLYNWCLDYENKNKPDKNFIHFQTHFFGDSILFSQNAPDTEIKYRGINYKDSMKLFYQTIYQGKINQNIKVRELNFKFYKLK